MKYYVYIHVFPNNKKYIGITSQKLNRRWRNGKGYQNGNPFLFNAIQKYGWDNIKHNIIYYNLTKEDACKVEQELIKNYKTRNKKYGYNLSIGGELSGLGYHHTKEAKEKISNAHKGKKINENQRKALLKYNLNKIVSTETKLKLSEATKKNWADNSSIFNSKKYKEKQSQSRKGHYVSEETKKKIGDGNRGKIIKKSVKEYLSEHNGKRVLCVETNVIYNSTRTAGKEMNISQGNISLCCLGKRKSANGYHWRYINEY